MAGASPRSRRSSAVTPGVAQRRSRGAIRLTRRGRIVCSALLVAMLSVTGAALLGLTPTAVVASSNDQVASTTEVVVQPGETLWTVAVRHEPHRDPVVTIEEIRRLNNLPGYTVHPGQTLRLP